MLELVAIEPTTTPPLISRSELSFMRLISNTMITKRKLITFDWAIKRLLRSKANFGILEGFLSELLKEDIVILDVLESENNKDNKIDKFNRVDLKVRNSQQEIIIIEIQYDREYDYLQRIFYGVSKTAIEYMEEGKAYTGITKVISINILYFANSTLKCNSSTHAACQLSSPKNTA